MMYLQKCVAGPQKGRVGCFSKNRYYVLTGRAIFSGPNKVNWNPSSFTGILNLHQMEKKQLYVMILIKDEKNLTTKKNKHKKHTN